MEYYQRNYHHQDYRLNDGFNIRRMSHQYSMYGPVSHAPCHGKTGVEKKDPNGDGPVRASQSAFLGPQIWDKTLSLDLMGDFKDFELEYMDLDEFFNENTGQITDDMNNLASVAGVTNSSPATMPNHSRAPMHSPTGMHSPAAMHTPTGMHSHTAMHSLTGMHSPTGLHSPTGMHSPTVMPSTTVRPSTDQAMPSLMLSKPDEPRHLLESLLAKPAPMPTRQPVSRSDSMSPSSTMPVHMDQVQNDLTACYSSDDDDQPPRKRIWSPNSTRNELADEIDIDSDELMLASAPGHEDFDPKKRAFSNEELRPQPVMKKSKKIFVPDLMKDDRYWCRRNKNNVAAKRSRDARRVKENQIALRASFLERENEKLVAELAKVRGENGDLRIRLNKYEKS